jgi:hypothetical protein
MKGELDMMDRGRRADTGGAGCHTEQRQGRALHD